MGDFGLLGFIGGTGPEGRGLALRLAMAGESVLIGSRDVNRAAQAVESISSQVPTGLIRGALNIEVAREADIVLVALPYAAQKESLEELRQPLAGKIVVEMVVPLSFGGGSAKAILVPEGSAALQAQSILEDSTVVAAFQNTSASDLLIPGKSIDSDVVVCADDDNARGVVMRLAEKIKGGRAVNGGGLENARYVEDFTALLININRIYKAHTSIRIVGI